MSPQDVNVEEYDKTSVNISWTILPCNNEYIATLVYLYYRDMQRPNVTWYVQGVDVGQSWLLLKDLQPASEYKAYLLISSNAGNGPPSDMFSIKTPVSRKLAR